MRMINSARLRRARELSCDWPVLFNQ